MDAGQPDLPGADHGRAGNAQAIPASPPDDGIPAGQVLYSEGAPNDNGGPTLMAGDQVCSSDLPFLPGTPGLQIHSGDVLIAALGTDSVGIEDYQIYDQQTPGVSMQGETVLHVGAHICFDSAAGGSVTATATSDSSASATISAAPCPVAQPGTGLRFAEPTPWPASKRSPAIRRSPPACPTAAHSPALSTLRTASPPTAMSTLNGSVFYVGGNVQINGAFSGTGALFVNGTLVLNGPVSFAHR